MTAPALYVSQPKGGSIQFFGDAPYPTTGYLRAGNDAGVILAFRNHANTADIAGITIGSADDHDDFVIDGMIAFNKANSYVRPLFANGAAASSIDLGQPRSDGAGAWRNMYAASFNAQSPFNSTVGVQQTILSTVGASSGVNPLLNYGLLASNTARISFRAGNVNSAVEVLNDSSASGFTYFQPSPVNGGGAVAQLGGGTANGIAWQALWLAAGTTTLAPLNMALGAAPTSPVNGQVWFTSAGMFYRAGGVTVGPLAAAGGGISGLTPTVIPTAATSSTLADNPAGMQASASAVFAAGADLGTVGSPWGNIFFGGAAGTHLHAINQVSGAGSGLGTISNTPNAAGGDPGFWIRFTLNGVEGYIPWWPL